MAEQLYDGKKNPQRRAWAERHYRAFRKTALTYAIQIREPFSVDTLEGLHQGKAGDYLAVGIHGEQYPIDQAVFEAQYEAIEEGLDG